MGKEESVQRSVEGGLFMIRSRWAGQLVRFLILTLPWSCGRLCAQIPQETARLLGEIRERLQSYSEDANGRRILLDREAETVRHLTDAGDAISLFATGASYVQASRKLEEARRVALAEPALPILSRR